MPFTSNGDTSCASTGCTTEDTEGHLNPRKGICVFTPEMGIRNSVPELVSEDSVKENLTRPGSCEDLEGFNNNVKATCLSEVCEEVQSTEKKLKPTCEMGDEHFETLREKTSGEKENGNTIIENVSKNADMGNILEDKVIGESCDSMSSFTITIDSHDNSNQIENNSHGGSIAEKKENTEQENELYANPTCNEIIDRVSENLDQDNGGLSLEVQKTDGKKIVGVCIEKETSKITVTSHCRYQNSCEGENNVVDADMSNRSIEITSEEQQNQPDITPLNFKSGKEGESVDTACISTEGSSDIVDQSPDVLEQQINEPKENKVFMKNKGQELDETKRISLSEDEIQSNHEQHGIEVHGTDNTCQNCDTERQSLPSSHDVNEETSLSENIVNANVKCEDNQNKKDSEMLPLDIEFNMELNTNNSKSPTKDCDHSSDNSPTKKSPIFQRGLFPRIAIKGSGIHATKILRKQLFIGKEKREKREQQERDIALEKKKHRKQCVIKSNDPLNFSEFTKICDSTSDIKLKHAQVNLVKMNASMLSKYNVHFSPVLLGDSVNKTVSLPSDGKSAVSEKRNSLKHKIEFQVEGEEKKSNFLPPKKNSDGLLKRSISACILESAPCLEAAPEDVISDSRMNCDKSSLEKISNSLTENGNNNHDGMEIKRKSKRRNLAHAFSPRKKQKMSEMKVARVNIWKIDDLVLLKYGYNSQGLKIDKAATVPSPSAHSSSVRSFVSNSQAVENHVLNSPIDSIVSAQHKTNVSIPAVEKRQLATMKNNGNGELNDIKISATNSPQNTNSNTAKKFCRVNDVPLSSRIVLNNSPSSEKSVGKTKCSVRKKKGNLKTLQVVLKRIDKESLSSHMLSKQACVLSPAKTNRIMKSSVKKAELDGKISNVLVKRNELKSLSDSVLFNKSQNTTKSVTKNKISIKNKYKLKTAQVKLKNINNSPLSSPILSDYLPSKRKSITRVSNTKLHIQSTDILHKRSLPKKQIISHSEYCSGLDNQNEVVNKACSSKGDVQGHSKENVCHNSDLKCLKRVRVNLYKLESTVQPKLLSSKSVLSL